MRTSYPSKVDLATALTGLGLDADTVAKVDTEARVAAGIERVERLCDRKLLADAAPSAWTYDPPQNGSTLFIDDFTSVTQVRLVSSNTILTASTDYWLEPVNAPRKGRAYNAIRFRRWWYHPLPTNQYQDVEVTGTQGYLSALPVDLWSAMMFGDHDQLHAQLAHLSTGGMLEWADGNAREKYGDTPLQYLLDRWKASVADAVSRYRRISL